MAPIDDSLDYLVRRLKAARLSLDEIQITATELLARATSDVARELFGILASAPPSATAANVLDVFRELSTREPEWVSIIDKSLKKKGRCPKQLKSSLKSLLENEEHLASSAKSFADLLAAEVFSDFETIVERKTVRRGEGRTDTKCEFSSSLFGKKTARIFVTRDLTDIRRMEDLAYVLASVENSVDNVVFDFSGVDHVYVAGLAAMKAWCGRMEITPRIENASSATERYLDMIGFEDLGSVEKVIGSQGLNALAIESLLDANPEDIASRLVRIIDKHMPLSKQTRSGLLVAFAELVENVHRHAGETQTAYACASISEPK